MSPLEFLKRMWPLEGTYCLATPYTTPTGVRTYSHKTFATIEEAAAFAERRKDTDNIFFAVHTLKEPRVWAENVPNPKTGEMGKWQVRVGRNMLMSKAYILDLDVGDSPNKFLDPLEAKEALAVFCHETGLPRPTLVSSGGGIHVYWELSEPVPSEDWEHQGEKLKRLCFHHKLKADPARTSDSSSVLRVAGTYNLKTGSKRPVKVHYLGTPTDPAEFHKLLDAAIIKAGVMVHQRRTAVATPDDMGLGSNTGRIYDNRPVPVKVMAAACQQFSTLLLTQGRCSEPEWQIGLNLLRFCENGRALAHKWSSGDPRYNPAQTDEKIDRLDALVNPAAAEPGAGPTLCSTMQVKMTGGPEGCVGCPFAGRVKTPLEAARRKHEAPQPVLTHIVGHQTIVETIPEPPFPWKRLASGKVVKEVENKEGDIEQWTISDYDLYPVRLLRNGPNKKEQHQWRAVLPIVGPRDFIINSEAAYDERMLRTELANAGVLVKPSEIKNVGDYMVAYIKELQRLAEADAQCNHLGWHDKFTKFVLPDRALLPDGSAKAAMLTAAAQSSSQNITQEGTLEAQVELLTFYNHDQYLPHQFVVLCGLASPIFFATTHHGLLVNAMGESGASKSTAMYTAASLWGHPELYGLNGTSHGATANFRMQRLSTLSNLPVTLDEITHMESREAKALAMAVTQATDKGRLERDGTEKANGLHERATIMICTSNSSLHSLLSQENAAGTAGSMRVFEIEFQKVFAHTKAEADAYLRSLKLNFGHVGPVFISWVVQNLRQVQGRVEQKIRDIDAAASIDSSERFWSAGIATVLVAGEIATELGLIKYDLKKLEDWCLNVQLPMMRGTVLEEYNTPVDVLANYMEQINEHILVVNGKATGNLAGALRPQRGKLIARYELDNRTMWINKDEFKIHCTRIGANSRQIVDTLWKKKIVTNRRHRKMLGAGIDTQEKGQTWCIQIDMSHPEIAGKSETSLNLPAHLRVVK